MRRFAMCCGAAVLLMTWCATSAPAAPADWKPDAKLAAELGPPVSVGQFSLRLPAGYAPISVPPEVMAAQRKGTIIADYADKNSKRSNGAAALGLRLSPFPASNPSHALILKQIDLAVQFVLRGRHRTALTWTQGTVEHGSISGIPFARVRFSRTLVKHESVRDFRSFVYLGIYQQQYVWFLCEDEASTAPQSLPLMEAAVLTFHAQPGKAVKNTP